jgi:ABC-type uncharacterized transport system permease subunit
MIRRIVPLIYVLIGLFVAYQQGYLANVTTLGRILSAVLAIILWPLVLFGIRLNIS